MDRPLVSGLQPWVYSPCRLQLTVLGGHYGVQRAGEHLHVRGAAPKSIVVATRGGGNVSFFCFSGIASNLLAK